MASKTQLEVFFSGNRMATTSSEAETILKESIKTKRKAKIGHFTVVRLMPWSLNRNEAGSDLVLLQIFLFFICK